jgi:hypothetical protein
LPLVLDDNVTPVTCVVCGQDSRGSIMRRPDGLIACYPAEREGQAPYRLKVVGPTMRVIAGLRPCR